MINLSVNINKVATIRNARGGDVPNVEQFAINCETYGADGITVHPRPDQRHIRRDDVFKLRPIIKTEFNIEGYPSPEFINLVLRAKPNQVTLVPDKPDQLTSNAGWVVAGNEAFLQGIIEDFREAGIRTSLFVDTDVENIKAAAGLGVDRIELYTEPYASAYSSNREEAVAPFVIASEFAHKCGLGINAGHDLNLDNLQYFAENVPYLNEVSIGHHLISDALYMGLERVIEAYKECLK